MLYSIVYLVNGYYINDVVNGGKLAQLAQSRFVFRSFFFSCITFPSSLPSHNVYPGFFVLCLKKPEQGHN